MDKYLGWASLYSVCGAVAEILMVRNLYWWALIPAVIATVGLDIQRKQERKASDEKSI